MRRSPRAARGRASASVCSSLRASADAPLCTAMITESAGWISAAATGRAAPRATSQSRHRVAEVGEAQPGEPQADSRPDERHDALSARVRARMSARLREIPAARR
jgi:hypothetical protein